MKIFGNLSQVLLGIEPAILVEKFCINCTDNAAEI